MASDYKKFILIFIAALAIGFIAGAYVVWRDFPI